MNASHFGTNILTLDELLTLHSAIADELLNCNRLRLRYINDAIPEGVQFCEQEISKLDKISGKLAKLIENRKAFKDSI